MKALVVRLDSFGDVLLAGPAVRAVAARCSRVTMLCGPRGEPAARLLPGVDDVIVWAAPWEGADAPTVPEADVDGLVRRLSAGAFDVALVLTSFRHSPVPMALLLRLAGVRRIGADADADADADSIDHSAVSSTYVISGSPAATRPRPRSTPPPRWVSARAPGTTAACAFCRLPTRSP
ncbi:hypothetical protein QFZ76_008628 [Streptomyces sp. V4I2]|nr:hypothetical protein [Streptomyces sp. V4I2]